MKKNRAICSLSHVLSSLFMIAALLWLTVSNPFVYNAQQELKKHQTEILADLSSAVTEEDNSPVNTTEEKTPAGISLSEEYLHHTNINDHPWFSIVRHHRDYISSLYIAFHGELFSPPPNA